MTFTRRNSGSGHAYYVDGRKIDGVTRLLEDGMPKPGLVNWAANAAADYVQDHWADLNDMTPSKRAKAVREARFAERSTALARGKQVHAIGEALAKGQTVVNVAAEVLGLGEAYARWLDDFGPTVTHVETSVLSTHWGYGGTFDLLCIIDGVRWLLDIKTGKSVYDDVALQLAAYRYADVALVDGAEVVMPEVDECGVVWVQPDAAQLMPVDAGEDSHRAFLYVAQVARWRRDASPIGEPVLPPGSYVPLSVVK